MRWLLPALVTVSLAACSTAPRKTAPPHAGSAHSRPAATVPRADRGGKDCSFYAPAQEDTRKRGNYTAGGLYAPGVADTTPDHQPDLDCIDEPVVTREPRSPIGNRSPYSVLGKQYRVMDKVDGYVERGTASYYGNKFHGRRTSNQEVYDMYAFTAAHKTLPLPSFARVTNLDNGRSVVVRVNDRGPFHEGRVIDLSYAAAVKLGITQRGTGRVEVRALTPEDAGTDIASSAPAKTPAAAGSGMDALVERLPATPASVPRLVASAAPAGKGDGTRYHVVPDPQRPVSADRFEAWMKANGVRVATGRPAAAGAVASAAPPPPAMPVAAVPAPAAPSVSPSALQLQVASFASRENADRALARLAAAGIEGASLSDVQSNGRVLWRLRVGVSDSARAEELAGRIAGLGFGRPQPVRD